jgi:hypothetical protein
VAGTGGMVLAIADGRRRLVHRAGAVRLAKAVAGFVEPVIRIGARMTPTSVVLGCVVWLRDAATLHVASVGPLFTMVGFRFTTVGPCLVTVGPRLVTLGAVDGWFAMHRRLAEGVVPRGAMTVAVRVLLRIPVRLGTIRGRGRTALPEEDIDRAGSPW